MVPGESNMLVPTQATSAADEPRVLCVIRDMTNSTAQNKITLNLPASTTCHELLVDVAKNLGYVDDTFSLAYEQQGGAEVQETVINQMQEATLKDICTNCGNGRRNNFNVMDKDGLQPVKVEPKDDWSGSMTGLLSGVSATAATSGDSSSSSYPATNYSSSSDYTYSYSSALIRSDTGYVGLVNQAMTCYLNSLLQTLYMTPEFRNAIYRWESGNQEDEDRSIPYQLQRLFLNLQTSNKRAVETTDITKSFGWDSSESWQQHDVQELYRVMFDALEKKWKNTDQADVINRLYQGKMKDYVKCLECKSESARLDTYLDIPLTLRPFGANQSYGSVEEALQAFVQHETLDGANQYMCEKCNKKCDAHKGLKFVTFPYLLSMQLKRFDFDYSTMHRIKLNDRMSFPEILNLNCLIEKEEEVEECSKGTKLPNEKGDDGLETNHVNEAVVDEGIDPGYTHSAGSVNGDISASSTEAATNDKNAQDSKKKGPFEFELFSIMIHSGSAAGGHYYAYIKSFKDGQWYCFNDQNVTTITYDDIQKTFGGSSTSRGYYSSAFASSTNAYMLMYRQIDKGINKDFMTLDNFPPQLKRELTNLKEKEETERKQREIDRCTCKIKLFCFHPIHQKLCESKLHILKDNTLRDATLLAWRLFELEEDVPKDCVRLVKYDEFHDWIELSYEDQDDSPMGDVLGGVKSMYTFDLLVEIKQPHQKFQEYKPGGKTLFRCSTSLSVFDAMVSIYCRAQGSS
jgi:ubiquitin carboxyl-terminal hydrolase 47